LLGVKVDILTPMSLPEKFREKVISEAKKIGGLPDSVWVS